MSHTVIIRRYIENSVVYRFPPVAASESQASRQAAADALDALEAGNERLRDGIEDYLLWEPGRRGHAEAHRKLAALVAVPP